MNINRWIYRGIWLMVTSIVMWITTKATDGAYNTGTIIVAMLSGGLLSYLFEKKMSIVIDGKKTEFIAGHSYDVHVDLDTTTTRTKIEDIRIIDKGVKQ